MAERAILQKWHLLLNGTTFMGVASRVSPPEIAIQTARYRAGGMDGSIPIDMGIGEMMFSFDLQDYAPVAIRQFGFQPEERTRIELRAAIEPQQGAVRTQIYRAAGLITTLSPGELTADDGANIPVLGVTLDCTFFSWHEDGDEMLFIDVPNLIRRVNGVDRLAEVRGALGVRGGGTG